MNTKPIIRTKWRGKKKAVCLRNNKGCISRAPQNKGQDGALPSDQSYLVPSELRRDLPEERVILV